MFRSPGRRPAPRPTSIEQPIDLGLPAKPIEEGAADGPQRLDRRLVTGARREGVLVGGQVTAAEVNRQFGCRREKGRAGTENSRYANRDTSLMIAIVMRLALALSASIILGGAHVAHTQVTAFVTPTGEIPRDSYQTWSLFLICSPDWVSPERSADLAHLYHRFRSFGDAIGRDNLAVWFWKRQASETDPKLAENADVARSAEFCKVLKQPPSQGPYIVVTTAYPDLKAFPADRAVFQLGGLPPAEIARLLNTVTDQLLLQGKVDAALAAARGNTPTGETPQPASSGLWMRLLEGTRQSLIGVGCMVKLQIVTGLLNAELRACSQ